MASDIIQTFNQVLSRIAPYMSGNILKLQDSFGKEWEEEFSLTLEKIFNGNEEKLENAIRGYVRFALDATKLHKRFEKEGKYINKTYQEAANAVYHNKEYMHNLYLPGILLSHFLWRHHYMVLQYFHRSFAPYVQKSQYKEFCEVGVGTGFYSRQLLSISGESTGLGVDISDHSLEYAGMQVGAFGFSDRWKPLKQNVMTDRIGKRFPFILSIEVLEHLEDPLGMLQVLKDMLQKDGMAFIVAAINAPNEDHIYLYNNCKEVILQLEEAGLTIVDYFSATAYEPRGSSLIPELGAFIVR